MFGETNGGSPRKPYVKPALTEIKLVPEEAALAGCKYTNISGPGYTGKCQFLGSGSACSAIRST